MNKTAHQWRPIGPMVELLAKGHHLTLGEIADYLGIHRNSMTEKVHGRRPFTEVEIGALASLFGVPAGRLFEDPLELLGIRSDHVTSSRCTGVPRRQPRCRRELGVAFRPVVALPAASSPF